MTHYTIIYLIEFKLYISCIREFISVSQKHVIIYIIEYETIYIYIIEHLPANDDTYHPGRSHRQYPNGTCNVMHNGHTDFS